MGIVDVDDRLVGQVIEGGVGPQVDLDDVLQRRRNEEVLLFQPQALALDVVVRRIEDLGDGLGAVAGFHRLDVLASGEGAHIEGRGALGAPQAERVDDVRVLAGNQEVIGDGADGVVVLVDGLEAGFAPFLFDLAVKVDLFGLIAAGDQPEAAHLQPVIRLFHLPAVDDLLAEDAELIPDRETGEGVAHRRGGVHIAGREPPEAAVAEAGVGFHIVDGLQVEAQLLNRLFHLRFHAEVIEVVLEGTPDQELHRHIVNAFLVGVFHLLGVLAPLLEQLLLDDRQDSAVHLKDCRFASVISIFSAQSLDELVFQFIYGIRHQLSSLSKN